MEHNVTVHICFTKVTKILFFLILELIFYYVPLQIKLSGRCNKVLIVQI